MKDPFACFIDDYEGDPHCVFDDGGINNCDVAYDLHEKGQCKSDCPHWRSIEGARYRMERIEQETQVNARILRNALKQQADMEANALRGLQEAATHAPVQVATMFGSPIFVRPDEMESWKDRCRKAGGFVLP